MVDPQSSAFGIRMWGQNSFRRFSPEEEYSSLNDFGSTEGDHFKSERSRGVDGVADENGNEGDIKDHHKNNDRCYQEQLEQCDAVGSHISHLTPITRYRRKTNTIYAARP